jgi:hypothetical protein
MKQVSNDTKPGGGVVFPSRTPDGGVGDFPGLEPDGQRCDVDRASILAFQ